ncbi:penicillin-binding protein 2 [Acidiferrimicrobium sp. IK]|uniref:peptidoglycan D,D-transpeptidase FtsI family protein n=1 Tax=Acidiferrimicrobium sp. IK TaxID=2871700 RepID=UPI0021CAEBEA|nr:penicillin-binding protein 2 [Acidiferrimicrobium sp. IK]MCU4183691.1 penicillin-binding protein 2 [Acidiferrimicrobium sp. IK]
MAIAARVVWIQGPGAGRYLAVGQSEWTHTVTLAGTRGSILDANGDELAMSIPQTTIYADPHQVSDPKGEAAQLAPALGQSVTGLVSKLTESAGFVYLARTVDDATAAKVAKLNLAGVYSMQEPKRFYPAGQLAQPIIGLVGTDGTGLGGLESKYNSILQGKPGKLIEQTDPQGRQLPGGLQEYKAPVSGQDLVLTIDESLQYDAEQALAKAIVAAGAKSGIAMLMDTKTGDILADANLTMPGPGIPSTIPAVPISIPAPSSVSSGSASTTPTPQVQPVEAASASAFTQVYEPGSVNKLITISAALQQGVIKPSDIFTIPNTYDVAGTTFHDAEPHATEHWNVTDILANSSNIGTTQIAQRLGKTQLLKYIGDYGEGKKTDIDFPGESRGLLPSYWSGTSIADVPIGQGIGVTAVQMLAAYNTIANGGVYVAPRLVAGTIGSDGVEHTTPITPGHRVVSPKVAAEMTTMLDEVVRVGTGTAANLSPYTVAGKTGTALVPLAGHYEAGHYVASFAGFVPSEDPSITAMVVINDTLDYGAAASAPTFATIARDALQQRKIPPHAPLPPAPGVPLATTATATGAGEVAGTPLPGLSPAANVAATVPTTPGSKGAIAPTTSATVPQRQRTTPTTAASQAG